MVDVQITPAAADVVLGASAAENDPEHLALWIEVTGANGNAYTYDIYFQALSDAAEDDRVYHVEELRWSSPPTSVDKLHGARLDWSDEGDGGLVIVNPNTPPRSSCAGTESETSQAIWPSVFSRCSKSR